MKKKSCRDATALFYHPIVGAPRGGARHGMIDDVMEYIVWGGLATCEPLQHLAQSQADQGDGDDGAERRYQEHAGSVVTG